LSYLFPDGRTVRLGDYHSALDTALDRVNHCFKHSVVRHYCIDGEAIFSHLFSDQYTVFIWFLANTIWRQQGNDPVLEKLFYLNKALHAFECMYDAQMPDIFFLSHTVGTVLGKATYSDFLVVSQGCTVGVHRGKYPILGKGVALGAHATVIGNCTLGKRVSIGSDTAIFQQDLADDMTAYTNTQGQLVLAKSTQPYAQKFFNVDLGTIL
jgi:serine O-acetyltransferase